MASTAADVLIESLQDWGVEIIFGLPGERQAGLPSGPATQTQNISPPFKGQRAGAETRTAERGVKQSTFPAGAFRSAKAHADRTLDFGTPRGAKQRPQGTFRRCSQSGAYPCAPRIEGISCTAVALIQESTMAKPKKWVRNVKTVSTYPPKDLFTKDAQTIAKTMAKKSVSPGGLGSGIRMIQYFINRAGKSLSTTRKRELERAKRILQKKRKSTKKEAKSP